MKKKYKMKKLDDLTLLKETLKQKIQLKASRMKQYKNGTKFYRQKKPFKTDKNKFHRKLGKEQVTIEKPPSKEEVETFSTGICSTERGYNGKNNNSKA